MFKKPVNLLVPSYQLLKVLPPIAALPLIIFGGFLSQEFCKFILMVFQVANHPIEFQQYHLFQRISPDIVGFVAGASVAPVVGTVEVFNGAVGVVDVVMQLMPAVGAVQQTGKGIDCEPLQFWITMNMIYSDYVKVAKKLGMNNVDFYACMAKAFLDDKDAQPDKLARYYEYVVKH